MRMIVLMLVLLCFLLGCSNGTVIPMSRISYDSSDTNKIVIIEIADDSEPIFELYGSGLVRRRKDIFQEEFESGNLSEKQIKQLLNHLINKQRVGDLCSYYPENIIPGIEMYPNSELSLKIRIDGFYKQIQFAYSNVGGELDYFREEERIDEETFKELDRLRSVFQYLMEYKY